MQLSKIDKIDLGDIVIRKILKSDKDFIIEIFKQVDVANNYPVINEFRSDYGNLVGLWLMMESQNEGCAWIVEASNEFSDELKPCGFLVAELANSTSSIMISYALSIYYRAKGIMTKVLLALEESWSQIGINVVEAFVSERNLRSIALVERLGFFKYKQGDKLDTRMIVDEKYKVKELWIKSIAESQLEDFYIIDDESRSELLRNKLSFRIWEEEISSVETGRFHFVFQSTINEKIVGISDNTSDFYHVTWELLKEEIIEKGRYMVFEGWGNGFQMTNQQFEGWKIGIDSRIVYQMAQYLISNNPQVFSKEKMQKVIGMENFRL